MENEIRTAETEQGDATNKGESSVDVSNNSPAKRARGRPKGSKKLQVCVTDVNLMELVPSISNGGSPPPKRERGRPKLLVTKTILVKESQSQTPRKRGRPKGSFKKNPENADSLERKADSEVQEVTVVKPRKRTTDNAGFRSEAENITDDEGDTCTVVTPRKRGRPKGSLNKTPRLSRASDPSLPKRGRGRPRKEGKAKQENGISKLSPRGRGRPRKVRTEEEQRQAADGPPPIKRGRGRPKGSLNKKPAVYLPSSDGSGERPRRESIPPCRLEGAIPSKKGKRGRPRKHTGQRGRPRKYPLPSPSELKKPKVWKPLGRPRKYPRVDPPEGSAPTPRRSRGRPRKSETKKGAHLRKNPLATPSSVLPRKSGAAGGDGPPRKRGRPKGSVNKNKARKDTPVDDSADVVLIKEEDELHPGAEMEPVEEADDAEETVIDQDADFEVSNQA